MVVWKFISFKCYFGFKYILKPPKWSQTEEIFFGCRSWLLLTIILSENPRPQTCMPFQKTPQHQRHSLTRESVMTRGTGSTTCVSRTLPLRPQFKRYKNFKNISKTAGNILENVYCFWSLTTLHHSLTFLRKILAQIKGILHQTLHFYLNLLIFIRVS